MIVQFLFIFGITYLGELMSTLFNLPIPGTILGMLLMFFLLSTGIIKVKQIEKAANILLINMAIFFLPPGIKLVDSLDSLKGNWLKLIIIAVTTTLITIVVTGKVVDFFIRRKK
ncbi:CidA/LrgA family protein [uncultured Ilyobacter sp.]|uniref:CidA/LrgA family protein n=1 Tax=uncultured Ilyobacter sp. TaxID=544433 RepID=UPI0029F58BC8|nr:CidA/LrgA family protein [uncultured Ilyobacter sp.]